MGNTIQEIEGRKNLDIVDLTGAGDLFAGGYLHGYLNNFSGEDCLKKGTEMSSKIIQQIGKLIIVTRGENGSIAINKDQIIECESKKDLDIKDLTGAGDLFAAGYLHGYINNLTIRESLEKGTDMSSKVIQQIGARLI